MGRRQRTPATAGPATQGAKRAVVFPWVVTWGRSRWRLASPIPFTSRRSSTLLKPPRRLRVSINVFARDSPMPGSIVSYAVWLYYRFNLSYRDIEDLLPERGITVSYEAIRLWCIKFGAKYAKRLKRKYRGYSDTFYIDEVFVKICGR